MSPNAKRREPVSHPHTACENAAEKSVPSKLFLGIGLIIGMVASDFDARCCGAKCADP